MIRLLLGLAILLISGIGSSAADRLALLIGNSRYETAIPLRNPENDIEVIAGSLQAVGFATTKVTNVDRETLLAAIDAFVATVKKAERPVVMVYFAGHGIQRNGRNFLLPTDAMLKDAASLEASAIDASLLASRLADTGAELTILVLDACRDDPLELLSRGAAPLMKGLAEAPQASGQLIAYSTAPGRTASDGDTGTSPYAAALAEAILVPGLDVRQVFDRVREKVMERTRGQQEPWENSAVYRPFHFVPPTTDVEISEIEAMLWENVALLDSAEAFQKYINRFPTGRFSEIARQKIININKDFSFRKQSEIFPIVVAPAKFIDFCRNQRKFPFAQGTGTALEELESYDAQVIYVSFTLPLRGILCPNNELSTEVLEFPPAGKPCGEILPAIDSEGMGALKQPHCMTDTPEDEWDPRISNDLTVTGGFAVKSDTTQLVISAGNSEYYRVTADAAEGMEDYASITVEGLVRVDFPPREEEAFSVWLEPVNPADLGLTWKYQNTLTAFGEPESGARILDLSAAWDPLGTGAVDDKLDSYWRYGGSLLAYISSGGYGTFVFVEPSDEMAAAGVEAGTIFIEAAFSGKNTADGEAYAFSARCAPEHYGVNLRFDKQRRRLTARGKRPRLDGTCRQAGSANEEIVLEYVAAGNDAETVRTRFGVDVSPYVEQFDNAIARAREEASSNPTITSYWDHNGSVMGLARFDDQRSIIYVKPRSALASIGIEEYTALFEGTTDDGHTYVGQAYAFSASCEPLPYPVKGTVSADNSRIVLEGKAPRRDRSCKTSGSKNERMVFDFLGTAESMDMEFADAEDGEGYEGEE